MTTRLNDYHDLPVLQALYEASGKPPYPLWSWTGDWSGWWLVAEDGRRPMGCVQVMLSKPQATLDLLCVPTAFSTRQRVRIVRHLLGSAFRLLKDLGVTRATFQLDPHLGDWIKVAQKHGALFVHNNPTYTVQVNA